VIWGTNAVKPRSNVMTHAIRARKERGAKIAAVDVLHERHDGAGGSAVLIRPGTDGALACAVMHACFVTGAPITTIWPANTDAPQELAAHVRERTPAWASGITGCDVATIEAFAKLIGDRKRSFFPASATAFPARATAPSTCMQRVASRR